ncbi:MAG: sigma-70 family RNA polymerase sigma factor [Syntrophomonadaceae bacterium]|jgi:RNA polymerase sigma-70 factor (ECF subfamily)|nr:sigma-70 family RNA polymerase sigma factor [Syntrophomonadaceae bacterium]
MPAEEILVKQSLQGDTLAFEKLILPYQNKIYVLAYRYMNNEEDAYDMTQEAFIKAFRSLRSFKGDSSFGTWIYRVATNVCLDELRRRKRRIIALSLDEPLAVKDGETVEKEIADNKPTQDIIIEQKEFSQYIQQLVSEMKPEHKNVIILRDMMQLSYEEIAVALDTSIGTVKSRLSRARNILRKKLVNREHLP